MFKRILVATDGSTLSKKAVRAAITLAALHDAQLVALTVVPRYPTAAKAKGVDIKTATMSSDQVAESVIRAARKHRSELIVMASHGRKGLKRLLLGSETQHVLTHSSLPVLVLR